MMEIKKGVHTFSLDGEVKIIVNNEGTFVVPDTHCFMQTNKPNYKHDCEACVYLGDVYDASKGKYLDLYVCTDEPTVVARWGNKGEEYVSGLHFVGLVLISGLLVKILITGLSLK